MMISKQVKMIFPNIKRLVYGTYKLPKDYSEFAKILDTCSDLGVEWLDTAPIYNDRISELWISYWQERSNYKFKVATKSGKFYGEDGRLYVSNTLEDIIKNIKESLKRFRENKLELLFLHDYEQEKTEEEIKKVAKSLLECGLVQRIGLSNFPITLSEYLINQSYISCLQVDCSASDKEKQILIAEKNGIDCWIYRPFDKGDTIRKSNKSAEEVITDLLQKYPNCRIVFGASEHNQIGWLKKIK